MTILVFLFFSFPEGSTAWLFSWCTLSPSSGYGQSCFHFLRFIVVSTLSCCVYLLPIDSHFLGLPSIHLKYYCALDCFLLTSLADAEASGSWNRAKVVGEVKIFLTPCQGPLNAGSSSSEGLSGNTVREGLNWREFSLQTRVNCNMSTVNGKSYY